MRLDGRIAIVTGGASGFGEGIARRFAAEGARVVVADRNEAATAAPLPDDGPVTALVGGDPFHFVMRTPGGVMIKALTV